MLEWFKKRKELAYEDKVKKIINNNSNDKSIIDLMGDILDLDKRKGDFEAEFEDECLKIYFKYFDNRRTYRSENEYKIWIKTKNGMELVFNRTRSDDDVVIKTFKMGYWIYHLYRIKTGDINFEETYSPEMGFDEPTEEKKKIAVTE